MTIVRLVAVDTRLPCVLERRGAMTRKAGNRDVEPHERVRRKVVIELQMPAPRLHAVTLRAVGTQVARMHVIRPVASGTLRAELLAGDYPGVADMAVQLLVRSTQF